MFKFLCLVMTWAATVTVANAGQVYSHCQPIRTVGAEEIILVSKIKALGSGIYVRKVNQWLETRPDYEFDLYNYQPSNIHVPQDKTIHPEHTSLQVEFLTETLLASERSAFHSVTTTTSAIKVRLTAGFKISPPPIGVSEGITPVVSETVLETYTICVTEIDD